VAFVLNGLKLRSGLLIQGWFFKMNSGRLTLCGTEHGRLRWLLPALVTAVVGTGVGWVAIAAHGQIAVQNQGYVPFSDAPIHYRSEDLSDPVAKLQQQMNRGKATLKYDSDRGYLRSVLTLLKVPIDSQTLVFSKTSFQYTKISPEHPRALYFNDDVYVGSVHDGKAIEIVSFDPMQGAIFYLLDEHKVDKPVFQRAELDCTQCHIAAGTRGVPGVLLRSIYPTSTGGLATGRKTFITDQNSPLKERWGGWYVTGDLGGFATMANAALPDPTQNSANGGRGEGAQSAGEATAKLADISKLFDASPYLIPDSDVVAHLVLAHQTQMHNLITLTNYRTRIALYAQASQDKAAGEPVATPSDAVLKEFQGPAEQLLRYMLFINETPLNGPGSSPIAGSSDYAKQFAARGPRDSKGRSLRDFDLKTRIFRYPCSYLIYTESFDAIPEPAKGYIYHRLLTILTGQDQSPDFASLTAQDRQAILEILLETKPGLPDEWKRYAKSHHIRLAKAFRHRPEPAGVSSSLSLNQKGTPT
jgi:hypothetical protein